MKTALFVLLLCVTATAHAGKIAHITQKFTDAKEWDRCAEKAVAKALAEGLAEGWPPGLIFGATGGGEEVAALIACGYAPAPKQIPANDKERLVRNCKDSPDLDKLSVADGFWTKYGPKYKAKAAKECKRIYNGAEGIAARAADEKRRQDDEAKRVAIAKKQASIVIRIGSPESDVYEKLGAPTRVNKTVTRNGVQKQLVYGNTLIYTNEGIVTSWQESE